MPPQFIQEVYWHYNKIKLEDLQDDEAVIDFGRGLSEHQKRLLKPVRRIPASVVESACKAFRNAALNIESDAPLETQITDVIVYEHEHFPGLQWAPSVLPPETQVLFVSQVMHKYLANSKHKSNLEADYDLEFPEPNLDHGVDDSKLDTDRSDSRDPALAPISSFFTYPSSAVPLHSKDQSNPKSSLNAAQFLSKKLRWLTLGAQYDWPTRSYPQDGPTTFPSDLHTVVTGLFPHIDPESGVCLLYSGKDYMPVHRDVSEQCQTGLASFSFGCDGIFVVAKGEDEAVDEDEKKRRTVALRVRSGDCVHMDGETRWAWHAMPRTIPGTCPKWLDEWPLIKDDDQEAMRWTEEEKKAFSKWKGYMGRKRLNVSCRQVWS
ncbi:hypothetical protein M8818_002080 [Zalaria obscura]|uniref:Uncharacterized protein n=1 Tax=Zalaria obscura TaxID=2024903 RepID=A0ACC3SJH5_9PEZI